MGHAGMAATAVRYLRSVGAPTVAARPARRGVPRPGSAGGRRGRAGGRRSGLSSAGAGALRDGRDRGDGSGRGAEDPGPGRVRLPVVRLALAGPSADGLHGRPYVDDVAAHRPCRRLLRQCSRRGPGATCARLRGERRGQVRRGGYDAAPVSGSPCSRAHPPGSTARSTPCTRAGTISSSWAGWTRSAPATATAGTERTEPHSGRNDPLLSPQRFGTVTGQPVTP